MSLALSTLVMCNCSCTSTRAVKDTRHVSLAVVDDSTGSPILAAKVVTGRYDQLPDSVLGRTDSVGQWQGSVDDIIVDQTDAVVWEISPEWLWVTCDGYVPQRIALASVPKSPGGSSADVVSVRLVPGTPLRGRVVDKDGKPVGNEPVLLVALGGEYPTQFQATTDADGRFEWKGCPTSQVWIAMGLDDQGENAVFEPVDRTSAEHGIRLPLNWQPSQQPANATLVYVTHVDDRVDLPNHLNAGFQWTFNTVDEGTFNLRQQLGATVANRQLRHVVIGISDGGSTMRAMRVWENDKGRRETSFFLSASGLATDAEVQELSDRFRNKHKVADVGEDDSNSER